MKRILIISFCTIALSGYSQQRLSLPDAVSIALKNSYDIQLAKNGLEISSINNHIGIAGGLPVVNVTINDNEQLTTINQKFADASRDNRRSNVGSNNLTAGITGSILLFNGFRVVTTKKRLEELQQQNQQLLNAQIQNTIAAVSTKYYDVVRQQSYRKTLTQSIDVSKQRLSILEIRKEVGMSNNADIFQAQLDLNGLLQTQQSQELVINQAKTDLLNLISLNPDTTLVIVDTIIIDRTVKLENIRSAIQNNPELLAASQQVTINELIERETGSLRYPTVRASTGYNFTNFRSAAGFSLLNQSYGPFIGFNIGIPIYNGGITKRQQRVASINTRSANIIRDNLYLDFETAAVRNYQSYVNTLQQLETEQKNYALSQQLLDLLLQRFQLGQATIIDVKLAQQSFENAGFRLVNLNYAAKVAEIELKRLANQLAL